MMKNPRPLVLLTNRFPYGRIENFLEKEVPFLLEKFSSVVIVPLFSDGTPRTLPPNVRVIPLPSDNWAKKITRALIEPYTYVELLKHPKAFCSPKTLKYILGYMSYSNKLRHSLKKTLEKEPELQQALFYTYWFHVQSSALVQLKGKFPRISVVSRAHGYDIYEEEYSPSFIPMRKMTGEKIDHIFPISNHGKKHLLSKSICCDKKVTVARLGTENLNITAASSPENHFSIVSCSYIVPEKRVPLMIEAIALFANSHPDITVTWNHFGGGNLYQQCLIMADHIFPSNIEWWIHGNMDNKAIYTFYEKHPVDLFFSASSTEGIPVSMMEAASCSIPILATNVGGVPEIVGDNNGKLVHKNSTPQEFANVLSDIFHSKQSLGEMRKGSYETWEKYFCMENNYRSFARILSDIE